MSNQVKIVINEEEFVIDSELFRQYKDEAFDALTVIAKAKANLKDVVTTVSEVTKLKKGLVSKFFKARFEEKIKSQRDETDALESLDAVVNGQAEEVDE